MIPYNVTNAVGRDVIHAPIGVGLLLKTIQAGEGVTEKDAADPSAHQRSRFTAQTFAPGIE